MLLDCVFTRRVTECLPTADAGRGASVFRLHPDANVYAGRAVDFLRQLDSQLDAPFTVIWDCLRTHLSAAVDRFLANLAIPDVNELADAARSGARSIQNRPSSSTARRNTSACKTG